MTDGSPRPKGQGHRITLALLCRPQPAIRLLGEIREHAPRCTVVYDTVDLHFRRLGRAADLAEEEHRTDRYALRAQAETSRALELLLTRSCDVTLVVSEDGRAVLRGCATARRCSSATARRTWPRRSSGSSGTPPSADAWWGPRFPGSPDCSARPAPATPSADSSREPHGDGCHRRRRDTGARPGARTGR